MRTSYLLVTGALVLAGACSSGEPPTFAPEQGARPTVVAPDTSNLITQSSDDQSAQQERGTGYLGGGG